MKLLRNRSKVSIAIALVLLLTITATFLTYLPVTTALTTLQLRAFIAVEPNPVGVGQSVTINVWTQPIPPSANDRFDNLSVTIWRPDGTTETLGPLTGGPLGNWVWIYVPGATGTHQVQFHVPDQPFPTRDLLFSGDTSPKINLTVQQQPLEVDPDTPLPTEYWTYPINAENRLWAATSGSWLRGGYNGTNYNPYTTGPKTSHISWRWRNAFGGLDGGDAGLVAYHVGRAYEGKMTPGIVINNYFYQYGPVGDRVNSPLNQLNCIDIATGTTVWTRNITGAGVGVGSTPLIGQIYEYDSSNQVGLHAYLWAMVGDTWSMYDAFNGYWIMNWENVHPWEKSIVLDPKDGNMLAYMINTRDGWMAMWNFTKACDGEGTFDGVIQYQSATEKAQYGVHGGMWRPRSTALNNWSRGIEWNVTIPVETEWMAPFLSATLAWGKISAAGGVAVAQSWWFDPILVPKNVEQIYGYSLDNDNPRKLYGPVNLTTAITTARAIGEDVYILNNREAMTYVAYDLYTGSKKWESDPMVYPWGGYANLNPTIAYGRLYAASYDMLHCWNITDGKELWKFTSGNSGLETPYGTWVGRGATIGDGKVYYWTGPWHPTEIMERSDRLYCVDAYTGKNIWNITFFADSTILANGHFITNNCYDNYIYDFSKGPSATTVSAYPGVASNGSAVLITGTVTDQSLGAKDTPAIADKFMDQWMEYLYMQQPKPMDAFGVPVMLQAYRVDDGSIIDIATVYSDINGQFEYLWCLTNVGTYKILATFLGSDAYWMSSAETALGVIEAPAAPAEPEPEEAPAYIAIDLAIIAAVVVAIVIGIVNLWALRKRK